MPTTLLVRDVELGIYLNPDRMHTLDHKGKYLKVRGPLNIARPIQGWPVIVQAGPPTPAASSPLKRRKSFSPPEVRSRMAASTPT